MDMASLHRATTSPHRGSVEVATLAALYGVYEVVRGRGHATFALARDHTDWIVGLERHLHVFGERALQQAAHALPGLPTVLGLAYILLHFVGTTSFLVWLHRRRPERFALVRNTLVGATGIALTLYMLFPVAPPRLAGLGFVDTVSHSAKVNLSSDLLGSLYNPFAAVPSLHFGYAFIVGTSLAAIARRPLLRLLALGYPALMLFVIVATGNHFFFDAAAGAVAVGVGYLIASWVDSATHERRRPAVSGSVAVTS